MSEGRLLGQDQIAELFGELDEMLRLSPGLQALELGVVGGAALVLRWGLRATYDVDFVSENLPADVRRSAAEIAARRGIQTDWLNDAAKGFTPSLSFNGMAVFEGNVLKVLVPDDRYLLAMKLFSSRETDLGDAVFLARQTGLSGADELMELVADAYRSRPIAVRVQYFVDEVVQRLSES